MDEKIIIPHTHSPSVAVLSKANSNNEKKKRSNLARQNKKRKGVQPGKKDVPSKDFKRADAVPLKKNAAGHIDIKV